MKRIIRLFLGAFCLSLLLWGGLSQKALAAGPACTLSVNGAPAVATDWDAAVAAINAANGGASGQTFAIKLLASGSKAYAINSYMDDAPIFLFRGQQVTVDHNGFSLDLSLTVNSGMVRALIHVDKTSSWRCVDTSAGGAGRLNLSILKGNTTAGLYCNSPNGASWKGDIMLAGERCYGIRADKGTVQMTGDITGSNVTDGAIGVYADGVSTVTVHGDINVVGERAVGVQATDAGQAFINGDVDAGSAIRSSGVFLMMNGKVTLNGALRCGNWYVVLEPNTATYSPPPLNRPAADDDGSTLKAGYLQYSHSDADGTRYLWVRIPPPPPPPPVSPTRAPTSSLPQTGDAFPVGGLLAVAGIALAGLCWLGMRLRKGCART